MPGLVGIISKRPTADLRRRGRRMLDSIFQGPDHASGLFGDEEAGLVVGWAVLPGSFASSQPFRSPDGAVTVVLSGDVFAGESEIRALAAPGETLTPRSGHWLPCLYQKEVDADGFLRGLNGSFCGLVVDHGRGTATLFADRFGIEALFWYEDDEDFLFASEIKALLAIRPELKELDQDGLAGYLAVGSVRGTATLFRGVERFRGGTCRYITRGEASKPKRYFHSSDWHSEPLSEEAYAQRLESTLQLAAPRYFRDGEDIAMSMTGGLDTRLICAAAGGGGLTSTYTFGGPEKDTLDIRLARRVAGELEKPHQVLRLQDDFLRDFAGLAQRTVHVAEGDFDLGGAHEIYLNEKARGLAPIRLTGNFGSEILRDVSTFKPLGLRSDLFADQLRNPIEEASQGLLARRKSRDVDFALEEEVVLHLRGVRRAAQSVLDVRTPYLDRDMILLAYQKPADPQAALRALLAVLRRLSRCLAAIPTDRGTRALRGRLVNRLSETWAWATFKAEYVCGEATPRWLMHLPPMLGLLESMALGRHKYLRYQNWIKGPLQGYVRDLLLDRRALQRSYLRPAKVRNMLDEHFQGRANWTPEICRLGALELLHRDPALLGAAREDA